VSTGKCGKPETRLGLNKSYLVGKEKGRRKDSSRISPKYKEFSRVSLAVLLVLWDQLPNKATIFN